MESAQAGRTEPTERTEPAPPAGQAGQAGDAEQAEQDAYHELCAYTLTHGDPSFIHQHVVDAYAAQHASSRSKAIGVAFALIGLYLQIEQGCSGRQVQLAHMRLARKRRQWPAFSLPPTPRGTLTALDVLQAPPGAARDQQIRAWCASVWASWRSSQAEAAALLGQLGQLGELGEVGRRRT